MNSTPGGLAYLITSDLIVLFGAARHIFHIPEWDA